MLVQTSSLLYHCSSGPTNSLPPGVLQSETYPPSEHPVKPPSRSPRHCTFWNCLLHLRWYWGPGNCCKPANAPSHQPRRLREVLRLSPTPLNLEPTTPPLDTDTVGHPSNAPSTGGHPNNVPSSGALVTITRFANAPYLWAIPHVAPTGHTYQHQPPQFTLSLSATLPVYPYEACHRLSSLPHMRLRLQPAVLGSFSQLLLQTDAADPHITHGRYFGVRSSTYSHRFPIARTPLRKKSANVSSSTVSAVINAIRKFSDNDSQDSSSATPNNSTQLSDVPHQGDWDRDTRKSPMNSTHLSINPPRYRAY